MPISRVAPNRGPHDSPSSLLISPSPSWFLCQRAMHPAEHPHPTGVARAARAPNRWSLAPSWRRPGACPLPAPHGCLILLLRSPASRPANTARLGAALAPRLRFAAHLCSAPTAGGHGCCYVSELAHELTKPARAHKGAEASLIFSSQR